MQFNPSSLLGCPGVLNAARAGNVTLANTVGNGVADDKALYPQVPELVRYYLGEEPVLANVDTYLLEDPDQRSYVLAHLDQLVLKPVDGSGGYGLVMGHRRLTAQLSRLAQDVLANPRGWIAQGVVTLSTSPTYTGQGFEPRHIASNVTHEALPKGGRGRHRPDAARLLRLGRRSVPPSWPGCPARR